MTTRTGAKWHEFEKDWVFRMHMGGYRLGSIADAVGRTEYACVCMIESRYGYSRNAINGRVSQAKHSLASYDTEQIRHRVLAADGGMNFVGPNRYDPFAPETSDTLPPETKKETVMSKTDTPVIEDVTQINGTNVSEYTSDQLIDLIVKIEAKRDTLKKIHTHSEFITKSIRELEASATKLAQILDSKG